MYESHLRMDGIVFWIMPECVTIRFILVNTHWLISIVPYLKIYKQNHAKFYIKSPVFRGVKGPMSMPTMAPYFVTQITKQVKYNNIKNIVYKGPTSTPTMARHSVTHITERVKKKKNKGKNQTKIK